MERKGSLGIISPRQWGLIKAVNGKNKMSTKFCTVALNKLLQSAQP
jgi:hypothetical protein